MPENVIFETTEYAVNSVLALQLVTIQ